ncbi:MAG: HTH-type transcriptional regulator CysB [Pseudomonadota bacterium]
MKLQQLRFINEVKQQGLNISAAAQSLYTSQPGVSTQIRLLEEELGIRIFERSGKQISGITPAGDKILSLTKNILASVEEIHKTAADFSAPGKGSLSIATTHTQACYVLPDIIAKFRKNYPEITFNLQQGTPLQIAEMASKGQVDFAIATEAIDLFDDLLMLPCYRWNRSILVPIGHPLCDQKELTLEAVAKYPIITYVFGFTGRSKLDQAFSKRKLVPNVVITAADADVIKTYVRARHGVGIIASMAFNADDNKDLCALDASHLFASSTTWIGLKQGCFLREFQYDFIHEFAPHLNTDNIDHALSACEKSTISKLFKDIILPFR